MSNRDPMTVQMYDGEEGYPFCRPNVHVEPSIGADLVDLLGIAALGFLIFIIVVLVFV